jgi:hypothetical protein
MNSLKQTTGANEMTKAFEFAAKARKASDDFSNNNVGRFLNADDWFKCYTIEVEAADACGVALQTAVRIGEPAYVVVEWQAAVDLHLAFASAAKARI